MELNGAEIYSFKEIRNSISSSDKAQYVQIPFYQRPYKWGGPDQDGVYGRRITDLISDYFSHATKEEMQKKYFAGSIVSVFGTKNGSEIKQELVDGQQRYTTLFLINFIGYLYSCKELINKYYEIMRMPNFSKDEKTFISILKSTIKSYLDNIRVHFGELYVKTEEYERQFEALKDRLINSLTSKEEVSREGFDILNVSYIEKNNLANFVLQYDRDSYNKYLSNALCSCSLTISDTSVAVLTSPLSTGKRDTLDVIERYYLESLEIIVEEINNKVCEKKAFDGLVKEILGLKVDEEIAGVNFCLIQTGNHEDAYTLFEVLNDRSLTLEDLEIIKNKFFRKYYLDNFLNPNFNEALIDKMDDLWCDVFNKNTTSQFIEDRTAALAISYICNDNGAREGSRTLLNPVTKYLNDIPQNNYSEDSFETDFNRFKEVKELLQNKLEIPGQKVDQAISETFYSRHDSFSNACFLAYGLGQIRVLVGLVAIFLTTWEKQSLEKFSSFTSNIHVEKISNLLWWIIFSAENWKKPKEISDEILYLAKDPNKELSDIERVVKEYVFDNRATLREELLNQVLNRWSYKSKNDKIKMRLSFQKIFKYGINNDGNILLNSPINTASVQLRYDAELDHLEPQKTDSFYPDSYYDGTDRKEIINKIGNMAPLMPRMNNEKSSKPITQVISKFSNEDPTKFYKCTIVDLVTNPNYFQIDSNAVPLKPKKEFFDKRTELIADYLLKIFDHEFN